MPPPPDPTTLFAVWLADRSRTDALFALLEGDAGDPGPHLSGVKVVTPDLWAEVKAAARSWTPPPTPLAELTALQLDLLDEAAAADLYRRRFPAWSFIELCRTLEMDQPANLRAVSAVLLHADLAAWDAATLLKGFLVCGADGTAEGGRGLRAAYLARLRPLLPTLAGPEADALRAAVAAAAVRVSAPVRRPLRIALCVSGQLRGFRQVRPAWRLNMDGCEVSTFVHVWRVIGGKLPVPGQFERCFSGRLLGAVRESSVALGWPELRARHAPLFEWFETEEEVSEAELRDLYRTDHVVVEDDRAPPVRDWSFPRRMYAKIAAAHDLARAAGEWDLMLRLRPDWAIDSRCDWTEVAQTSRAQRSVCLNYFEHLHATVGYVVGDVLAAGAPEVMDVYARAYARTLAGDFAAGGLDEFRGHANIAYALAYGGVRMTTFGGRMPGAFVGPPPIDPATALALIRRAGPPRDAADRALLAAAEADAAEGANA